jgi:hypothetical protein
MDKIHCTSWKFSSTKGWAFLKKHNACLLFIMWVFIFGKKKTLASSFFPHDAQWVPLGYHVKIKNKKLSWVLMLGKAHHRLGSRPISFFTIGIFLNISKRFFNFLHQKKKKKKKYFIKIFRENLSISKIIMFCV